MFIIGHGSDQVVAGVRQVGQGNDDTHIQSGTEHLLQGAGLKPDTAHFADTTISIIATAGGSGYTNLARGGGQAAASSTEVVAQVGGDGVIAIGAPSVVQGTVRIAAAVDATAVAGVGVQISHVTVNGGSGGESPGNNPKGGKPNKPYGKPSPGSPKGPGGEPLDPKVIDGELGPSEFEEFGDPNTWKFKGYEPNSGDIAKDLNQPEGSRMIYENWIDQYGRPVKITYTVHPDDSISAMHFEGR